MPLFFCVKNCGFVQNKREGMEPLRCKMVHICHPEHSERSRCLHRTIALCKPGDSSAKPQNDKRGVYRIKKTATVGGGVPDAPLVLHKTTIQHKIKTEAVGSPFVCCLVAGYSLTSNL